MYIATVFWPVVLEWRWLLLILWDFLCSCRLQDIFLYPYFFPFQIQCVLMSGLILFGPSELLDSGMSWMLSRREKFSAIRSCFLSLPLFLLLVSQNASMISSGVIPQVSGAVSSISSSPLEMSYCFFAVCKWSWTLLFVYSATFLLFSFPSTVLWSASILLASVFC